MICSEIKLKTNWNPATGFFTPNNIPHTTKNT